jgi:hypothetical protein
MLYLAELIFKTNEFCFKVASRKLALVHYICNEITPQNDKNIILGSVCVIEHLEILNLLISSTNYLLCTFLLPTPLLLSSLLACFLLDSKLADNCDSYRSMMIPACFPVYCNCRFALYNLLPVVLSSNDTLVSHLFLYPGIDMNVIPAF